MKKINLLLIAILLVVTVSPQNRRAEKKLVGTWTLENIYLENADEFAQTILDMQVDLLDKQIALIENMIKDVEYEDVKQGYVEQLENLKTQKEEFTLESVKEEINNEFDNLKGNLQLIFNKDKTYKNITEGNEQEGTWQINNEGKELIITENERDISFSISKLTKKKLEMTFAEEQAEMKMKMRMKFSKN